MLYNTKELLSIFDQTQYYFNVREKVDRTVIKTVVQELILNYSMESDKISHKLLRVQDENVFDCIK